MAVPEAPRRPRGTTSLRRLWLRHEEGVLYAVAVLVYVPLGVVFKAWVLN